MIDVSPEAWATIGVAIAAAASTVTAIVVAHLKTSRQARGIADHVEDVRKLAEPTGNGFADKVTEGLQRIEARLERIDDRQARTDKVIVEHLGDHARAQINQPREGT